MKKQGTVVAAEAWLEGLVRDSPTFHAQVEERFAAINVAQDLAALRVSRGLSQTQRKGLEAARTGGSSPLSCRPDA